jgi:hypothetical protein
MSAKPVTRYTLADLRKAAPRRTRVVPRHPTPARDAWYRQLHRQIRGEKRPVSGRAGRYVYYWAYGRLCWRVYVVPKDPRTPAQRRSRAAFGSASKAWSKSPLLTPERRAAWRAAAANTKSVPRLGQSGRLNAQQTFVQQNSLKEQWDQPPLLEPAQEGRNKSECRVQNPESPTPPQQPPAVSPSRITSTLRSTATEDGHHASLSPSQLPLPQSLTRPSSDRFRTAPAPLPYRCRWAARAPGRLGDHALPRWSSTLPQIHRSGRFRELWRGG